MCSSGKSAEGSRSLSSSITIVFGVDFVLIISCSIGSSHGDGAGIVAVAGKVGMSRYSQCKFFGFSQHEGDRSFRSAVVLDGDRMASSCKSAECSGGLSSSFSIAAIVNLVLIVRCAIGSGNGDGTGALAVADDIGGV